MAEAKIRLSVDGATASVAALNSVQGVLNTLSGSVKSLGGGLAGLGLSLSVGSVVAYFAAINKGVDALNDLKDATGASIENISALEDVAARTGAGFDVVSLMGWTVTRQQSAVKITNTVDLTDLTKYGYQGYPVLD